MNTPAQELIIKARKVIGLQILIGALVATGFYVGKEASAALSAGFGTLISIVLVYLLSRSAAQAINDPQLNRGMVKLYLGAVLRFVLVLALFIVALAVLKLDAVASIVGFGTTQLAYAMLFARRENTNE